jgi:hypothetical protein
MSDNSRLIPLVEAFLAYLKGEETTAVPKVSAVTSTSVKTGPSSAPAKAAKPAKPAKPAPGSDTTDSEEAEETGPTQETIGNLVEQLLAANKRAEAVKLMAKIGGKDAKSVTSLMASGGDLNKFVAEAEALLMAA